MRAVAPAHGYAFGLGADAPLGPRLLRGVKQLEQIVHPAKGGIGFRQRVL
jgi:hypothetical protein